MPAGRAGLAPWSVAVLASVCAVVGLLTVWDAARALWGIWLTDDLKSMGMVVPLVCWLLVLRAWRSIGWVAEGEWWGFAVLAGTAALMFVRDQMLLIVTVNKDWLLQLPPLPLIAVLYALGMVVLFGGRRLLRAAWFPVAFMWAVIPVPQTFSRRVDLPLQHASAHIARAFAHLLGQPLTQDRLRLMFTPQYGMFIAPGCNGIRGAITLGMAAVVVGYLYRFRWQVWAAVVAGAVMLGYLFNFLRLCLLVVYYKISLPYPWLQDHARNADYVIGGCLFLCALAVFFTVANRLRRPPLPVAAAQRRRQQGGFCCSRRRCWRWPRSLGLRCCTSTGWGWKRRAQRSGLRRCPRGLAPTGWCGRGMTRWRMGSWCTPGASMRGQRVCL